MFPINQIIPRSLYTPPTEVMPYYQASCRSNNCTWDDFTSLAVCVDMKSRVIAILLFPSFVN